MHPELISMAKKPVRKQRESFGSVTKLPSGRWRANYLGPDEARHKAPTTFDTLSDARAWVRTERISIDDGSWVAPARRTAQSPSDTFSVFAHAWLANRRTRKGPLKPRTRSNYAQLLRSHILPFFGDYQLREISVIAVEEWFAALDDSTPTAKAHAYSLLKTIMATAEDKDLIVKNPCRIMGASAVDRRHVVEPATLAEIDIIVERLPDRYRLLVQLAVWCAFRWGELTELRRGDVDLKKGRIRVERGVTRAEGVIVVGDPKSEAGKRWVSIPPHIIPEIRAHLSSPYCHLGQEGLLFPSRDKGGHLSSGGVFWKTWDKARREAGRPDLHFHDLRHTGATMAARVPGVTTADLMERLGHSTPMMAIHYQHTTSEQSDAVAAGMSRLVRSE